MKNVARARKKGKVGPCMRHLKHAFEAITLPATAEKIAFHLAELKPEFSEMVRLLTQVEETKEVPPATLDRIIYFVEVHWPYHFKALKRLAANIGREGTSHDKRQSGPANSP